MENQINDNNPENTTVEAIDENQLENLATVIIGVHKNQLDALIEQNQTMKTEIGQLVSLFQIFTPLLSGKGMIGLMSAIPKLINDPAISEKVQELMPIIDKYTINPDHD